MKEKTIKFSAPLTAQEIQDIDVLHTDIQTNDNTLRIALNYHSNRHVELIKGRKKFWTDLAEKHKLDLENKKYEITGDTPYRNVTGEIKCCRKNILD